MLRAFCLRDFDMKELLLSAASMRRVPKCGLIMDGYVANKFMITLMSLTDFCSCTR